jgi:hypothetical protein
VTSTSTPDHRGVTDTVSSPPILSLKFQVSNLEREVGEGRVHLRKRLALEKQLRDVTLAAQVRERGAHMISGQSGKCAWEWRLAGWFV